MSLTCYRQLRCKKVMFSQVSVCHSVQGEGRSHVNITCDAFDLTVQGPLDYPAPPPHPPHTHMGPGDSSPAPSGHGTWGCPHTPASDIWWTSLETCSKLVHFRTTLPTPSSCDIWWLYGWCSQLPKFGQVKTFLFQKSLKPNLLKLKYSECFFSQNYWRT